MSPQRPRFTSLDEVDRITDPKRRAQVARVQATKAEQLRDEYMNRVRDAVRELHAQGERKTVIAQLVGVSKQRVSQWLPAEGDQAED